MQVPITDAIRNEFRAQGDYKSASDNERVYDELDWINQTHVGGDVIGYKSFNGDDVFFN